MFQKIKLIRISHKLIIFLAISLGFIFALSDKSLAQESKKKIKLTGRVFGVVASLSSGAGVGPDFTTLIVRLEKPNADYVGNQVFVRIIHESFKSDEDLTPDFFNFENIYKFEVARKTSCDEKPIIFAFEQFGEEKRDVLQIMNGAKEEWLDKNAILPCYILRSKNYQKKRN